MITSRAPALADSQPASDRSPERRKTHELQPWCTVSPVRQHLRVPGVNVAVLAVVRARFEDSLHAVKCEQAAFSLD